MEARAHALASWQQIEEEREIAPASLGGHVGIRHHRHHHQAAVVAVAAVVVDVVIIHCSYVRADIIQGAPHSHSWNCGRRSRVGMELWGRRHLQHVREGMRLPFFRAVVVFSFALRGPSLVSLPLPLPACNAKNEPAFIHICGPYCTKKISLREKPPAARYFRRVSLSSVNSPSVCVCVCARVWGCARVRTRACAIFWSLNKAIQSSTCTGRLQTLRWSCLSKFSWSSSNKSFFFLEYVMVVLSLKSCVARKRQLNGTVDPGEGGGDFMADRCLYRYFFSAPSKQTTWDRWKEAERERKTYCLTQ